MEQMAKYKAWWQESCNRLNVAGEVREKTAVVRDNSWFLRFAVTRTARTGKFPSRIH
jgi:hypothetical protein